MIRAIAGCVCLALPFAAAFPTADAGTGPAEPPSNAIRTAIGKLLGDGDDDPARLREFYARRDFRPAWVGASGPGRNARIILQALRGADADGLDPGDYDVGGIAARMKEREAAGLARLDIMLSRAVSRFIQDLDRGRLVPRGELGGSFVRRAAAAADDTLGRAAAASDLRAHLRAFAPRSPAYRRLRRALSDYRRLAANGGWPLLGPGETLRLGSRDARVAALRRRLVASGDIADASGDGDPLLFDADVERAVIAFQRRHGLETDGLVGPMTRAALNVPVDHRIGQMALNLERRRWMPDDLGEQYVFVNMADFLLKVVDRGRTVFDMRVVVGRPYWRTPVFSGAITYLQFRPYWNIPRSIARQEIVPRINRDVDYLFRQGIRVFSVGSAEATEIAPSSVDWSTFDRAKMPIRLRQDPGPLNPLGRVKFIFPNRFDVYLHDTPSRELFKRANRAFSHGCIRVEKPVELAAFLLRDKADWTAERVTASMDADKTFSVRLTRPMPIHLTYLTAWVNRDGSVHFRDDIYGRDGRLTEALRSVRRERGR